MKHPTVPEYGTWFALACPSEKGFWSDEDGWVYDTASATQYDREAVVEMSEGRGWSFPSVGHTLDAFVWVPTSFDEG